MGEALGLAALAVIVVVGVGAFLARMIAQILKDAGREKKVTECIASLNMLQSHIAVYQASGTHTTQQVETINRMVDAWNERYSRWRGFVKIPHVAD